MSSFRKAYREAQRVKRAKEISVHSTGGQVGRAHRVSTEIEDTLADAYQKVEMQMQSYGAGPERRKAQQALKLLREAKMQAGGLSRLLMQAKRALGV